MERIYIILILAGIIFAIYFICVIYTNITLKKENEELKQEIEYKNKINKNLENQIEKEAWNYNIQLSTIKDYTQQYKPNKPIKVLVGDYIESSILNTNRVLRELGVETYLVPNGNDIIETVKTNVFDAIITNNIYKDHIDGPTILNKLRENKNFDTPTIILTVSDNEENYFINQCGFDDYLVKLLDDKKAMNSLKKVIPGLKFSKLKK